MTATVPGVTLVGTIKDAEGNGIVDTVTLTLLTFGGEPPYVAGALIDLLSVSNRSAVDGTFSISFFGNYQIQPAGSAYTVRVGLQGELYLYQFMSAGTYELSTLVPVAPVGFVPPAGFVPTGTGGGIIGTNPVEIVVIAEEIVPVGVIDSTDGTSGNAVFSLPDAPQPLSSFSLFKNGQRLMRGLAYTLAGTTVTYNPGYVPMVGDSHICSYRYVA